MSNYLYEKIYGKVVQVISSITGTETAELSGATVLQTDLGMDSLSMFEVVVDLEAAFAMQITDEEVDRIKTIDDIVHFILKKEYAVGPQE